MVFILFGESCRNAQGINSGLQERHFISSFYAGLKIPFKS